MDSVPHPHINDLLKIAGVESPEARCALEMSIQIAQADNHLARKSQEGRAPPELFEQLEKSIKKTIALLGRLEKYPHSRDIGFEIHPVGGGIVDAATIREMILQGRDLVVSRRPWTEHNDPRRLAVSGMVASVSVRNLLLAFQATVRKSRKRKRGQPKKDDKMGVAFYAAGFFCLHSPHQPSSDFRNPFRDFAEQFYKAVTGIEVKSGSLDWQIREVLKARRRAGD
jgi:hypothetical protein